MTKTTFRLIAILRGITPEEAPAVARALYEEGVREIEVPTNSPEPFASIRLIREAVPADCLVGAGTVLQPEQVDACHRAGGTLVVAPNFNPAVVSRALELGMTPVPGVATPTEAFMAISAGARTIKAFPGETIRPEGVKAWRAVLPRDIDVIAVGGVGAENLAEWRAAGASGGGIGGWLYRPGRTVPQVSERARALMRSLLHAGG